MHISPLRQRSDWAFLALRLIVAVIFFYHGQQKWALFTTEATGMPAGLLLIMRVLGVLEPLAAIAVLVGIFTQVSAIGLSLVMISAIVLKISMFQASFGGQGGWEFELAILAGSLVLAFYGAGDYSLDHKLFKKK